MKTQIELNEMLAEINKKIILQKLKEYHEIVNFNTKNKHELSIHDFWEAKKEGRIDNLNRLSKINLINQDRTL